MLFNINLLESIGLLEWTELREWIGYLASVVVAVSLTMSSIKRLRWLNMFGSGVFAFYGFAIHAYPVGVLNLFIVFVNIYYLRQMYSAKDSFKAIKVNNNDAYLEYFIDFYSQQITNFFPSFSKDMYSEELSDSVVSVLLIRNAVVAGVFIGVREGQDLRVVLDFVAPAYRDLKPGEFIYQKNKTMFNELGLERFKCLSTNKAHQKYLSKMGFGFEGSASEVFVKSL